MYSVWAERLSKRFGDLTAVDSLTFEVERGKVFALLGPNGAGKTTTIRMLSCILSSTSGSACVAGYDTVKEPEKVRRVTGIVTESPALYERLTAEENLEFFATAYGLFDAYERRLRINKLLEEFDLFERKDDRVGTFSKGMKQKLSFIRAIIHQPEVIMLDEPTSSLDPSSTKRIWEKINSMKDEGKTIILSTHRLEDVERTADWVMVMAKGRSVAFGRPEELMDLGSSRKRVEIRLKKFDADLTTLLNGLAILKDVTYLNDTRYITLEVDNYEKAVPEIVRILVQSGAEVLSVMQQGRSLEEFYMKVVGSDI